MQTNRLPLKLFTWRLKYISDNNFILLVSSIVGMLSGLAAVTLKSTVHSIQHFLEHNLDASGINYLYLGLPLIGICVTVLFSKYILKEKLGHGVTHVLYCISKNSSIVGKSKMYSRMITSALTVGFGGSVGLEAPIVVTGSAIGSNFGQFMHLNYKRRTLMVACGAAGAIAGIFNSPIAGVIFAIEVILTDITVAYFIPILIASVSGSIISLALLGDDILFSFRLQDSFNAHDVPYYILLGLCCGLVSLYFTRLTYWVEKRILSVKGDLRRSVIGGLILAVIILSFPPIYGEGYNTIKQLLNGNEIAIFQNSFFYAYSDNAWVVLLFVAAVIIVKPIASALTIGAGGSGGIFAPSLFIGGLTGYLFARSGNLIAPEAISLSNFTLVGMCGVMSGVLHAPLTAIFLIAEITSGYTLFVPLMLVSAISFTTISYFEKYSIYTKNLIEKGDLIQYDKDRQVLSLINLPKIIETDLLTILPQAKLGDLVQLVQKSKRNIFPVVNSEGILEGIVTLDDIREQMFDENARQNTVIETLMSSPPASVSSTEKMQSVMNKFEVTQAWNLPVIDNGLYVGFISKSRIFNAYRKKLIRQTKE